tara:strand:+ start:1407 stop:2828 length:1422 start_codon:yes stop_codon:yes gene_type:complete
MNIFRLDNKLTSIIISKFTQIIHLLIGIKALTFILDPSSLGLYYIILTYIGFYNLVLLNPPSNYLFRNLYDYIRQFKLKEKFISYFIFSFIIALISFITLLIISFSNLFVMNITLIFITSLYIFLDCISRNVLNYLLVTDDYKSYSIYSLILNLGGLLIALILLFNFKEILSWFIGLALFQLIICPILIKKLPKQKYNLKIDYHFNTQQIKYIVPLFFANIFVWFQSQGFRFLIENNYDIKILGLISVGLFVSNGIFSTLESLMTQYFNPIIYKKMSTNEVYNVIDTLFQKSIIIFSPIIFILVIFKNEIFLTISSAEYFIASSILIYGGVSEVIRISSNILRYNTFKNKKTQFNLYGNIIGSVSFLICFYLMIYLEFNFIEVIGISLIASNISTFILLLFLLKRIESLRLVIINNKLNLLFLAFIYLIISTANEFLYLKALATILIIIYIIYNVNSTLNNVKKYNYTSSGTS